MKGVVFIGGIGPPREMCEAAVEDADIIAAADSGLMLAEAMGIKPNLIIGDMDSLDKEERLNKYPPEAIIRHPHEKDYTDTELALNELWERGYDEVSIVGGGGGRTDHILALYSLFERDPCPARWYTCTDIIIYLDRFRRLTRTLDPGEIISVFPLGENPWKIKSEGLKWPLDDIEWDRGVIGMSNTALITQESTSRTVRLTVERGKFLIVMPFAEMEIDGTDISWHK